MLTLSTAKIGTYTTYLQLLNLTVPADIKVVKVTMEVVTLSKVPGGDDSPFFTVHLHGSTSSGTPIIDISNAQLDHMYHDRSFVIKNTSSVPLQFFLTNDLVPEHSASELFCSLSINSIRRFKTILIEPRSHQRIYVFYKPNPHVKDGESGNTYKEVLNIFINCRVIKDHRKVVTLQAIVMRPSIKFDNSDVCFVVPPVPQDDDSEWPPPELASPEFKQTVMVRKLNHANEFATTKQLDLKLKHLMGFFTVNLVPTPAQDHDPEQTKLMLEISLNLDALRDNRVGLRKDRFVEERLRIYDAQQLPDIFEKHLLHVRLSCGPNHGFKSIRTDTFDVSNKFSACQAIEMAIVHFLQGFHVFWSNVSQQLSNSFTGSADTEQHLGVTITSSEELRKLETVLCKLEEDEQFKNIFLDYCFLTEELIYLSLKGQASGSDTHTFVGDLASLLYTASLQNRQLQAIGLLFQKFGCCVPKLLSCWVDQLAVMLSYLPESRSASRPMRNLLLSLEWANVTYLTKEENSS